MGVLKEYYNKEIHNLKLSLSTLTENTSDQVIRIKMNEIVSLLSPIEKTVNIKDEDITNLLRFYELENELKQINP
jgi:CBS-domain-containing membrane protein